MMPSPPGRFSTMTGVPHRFASLSAKGRAVMSPPLPAGNGVMIFTTWVGQDWACPGAPVTDKASVVRTARTRLVAGIMASPRPMDTTVVGLDGRYETRTIRSLFQGLKSSEQA